MMLPRKISILLIWICVYGYSVSHVFCEQHSVFKENALGCLHAQLQVNDLTFKNITSQDANWLENLFQNKQFARYFTRKGRPYVPKEVRKDLEKQFQYWAQGIPGSLIVKKNGTPIGWIDVNLAKLAPDTPREAEISFGIHPKWQGKKYGYRIVKNLIEQYIPALNHELLSKSPIRNLYAKVALLNIPCWKILDQLGFSSAQLPKTPQEVYHRLLMNAVPEEACESHVYNFKGQFLSSTIKEAKIFLEPFENALLAKLDEGKIYKIIDPLGQERTVSTYKTSNGAKHILYHFIKPL